MIRVFLYVLFFCQGLCAKPLDVQIETPHVILMNAETGAIIYEKNANKQIFPASTTKIATTLYILKTMPKNLEDIVRCLPECLKMTNERAKKAHNYMLPAHWLEPDGSSAHLMMNEEMSIKDLLYGAMLSSGNDATNVLAHYVSEDIPTFVKRINEMIQDLGCQKTNFCNPHGLHHPDHMTCAHDMALICREALKYEKFREIVGTVSYLRPKTNKQNESEFRNTNGLIHEDSEFYYSKALGGKTGRTKKAKFNLVAVAKDDNRELIAVLHKSPGSKQRYRDAISLFEAAFAEKKEERLLFKMEDTIFEQKLPGGNQSLLAQPKRDIILNFFPSEEVEIKSDLIWEESK